jgi:hypothetical protein
MYPLILNKVDSMMDASIIIPGHFWYGLTEEQLAAILPGFDFPVSATVNYTGDGSVFNIHVFETDASRELAMYSDFYIKTQIVIAPGEVIEDVVYTAEVKTSDVYGVPVTAGVAYGNAKDVPAAYIADFKIDGIAYKIRLMDSGTGDSGLDRLTFLVNEIIRFGAADLSILENPVIPELRDEKMTLEKAGKDPDFGAWLPKAVPSGFAFESAHRFINQDLNMLSAYWNSGLDYIDWRIQKPTEGDLARIVKVSETEKYNMDLYPVPWADSIPDELWDIVQTPVFRADELTLDVVRLRAYSIKDAGDTSGPRMQFGVLFGDVLVSINSKGVSPEKVFEMLQRVRF